MESVIVGVVGILQFDVLERRLKSEYGVEVRRQPLHYSEIRWVLNDPNELDISKLRLSSDVLRIENMREQRLLLFTNEFSVRWTEEKNPELKLAEFGNVDF